MMRWLLICAFFLLPGFAGRPQSPLSAAGFKLYKDKKPEEACRAWIYDAEKQLVREANSNRQLDAAINYVLATIVYEQLNNSYAYNTWANALRLVLESGTTWELKRRQLKDRVVEMNLFIKGADRNNYLTRFSKEDYQLYDLDGVLHLIDFTGPKPGLSNNVQTPNDSASLARVSPPANATSKEGSSDELVFLFGRGINSREEAVMPGAGIAADSGLATVRQKMNDNESRSYSDMINSRGSFFTSEDDEALSSSQQQVPEAIAESSLIENKSLIEVDKRSGKARLSPGIKDAASAAWSYFISNFQASTGLVNPVSKYNYATMWDIGSMLAGIVSAHQLGIIDSIELRKYLSKVLSTLANLSLYNNELPNREYNVANGNLLSLRGNDEQTGSGWSAIDIGRFLIWLRIIYEWYPGFRGTVLGIMERFNFGRMIKMEEMWGTLLTSGKEYFRQEGRFGYEEYSASGYLLWNLDLKKSCDLASLDSAKVFNRNVYFDKRNNAFLTSDPFFLLMMEVGTNNSFLKTFTNEIYQLQKERWVQTGILTAIGEDATDLPPYFVYNNLYYEQKAWFCSDHKGNAAPGLRSQSTKASFAWFALKKDEYSDNLVNVVLQKCRTSGGFYAGIYENGDLNRSLNINTNAVILESILFMERGQRPFINQDINRINQK